MKRKILLLILSFAFISGFSQSLELYFDDELLEPGEEIIQEMHADSGMFSFHGLEVKNSSTNPLNIMCAREVLEEIEDTQNSFCWGICYSPEMDTSTLSLKINSGSVSEDFIGDYFPNGNAGNTRIRYVFYDLANPDDQVEFIITYKASTESGINDDLAFYSFSPVYPNPANKIASIDYEINGSSGENRLVVYNLLGSVVKDINLPERSGTIRLNTSNLEEGIYFYSLLINNESLVTQKLVVKH